MRNSKLLSTSLPAMAALALGSLLALGACGPSKVSECNELIAVINKGIESLEKGQKAGADPSGTAELKAMADAMDKVADEASKVNTTIPELKDFSGKYQQMAKDVAKSAREMAEAADGKDLEKMSKAQAAMETAVKQEDPLVDGINKFCGAP
jgi:methyl-accepting chemotaxis protein